MIGPARIIEQAVDHRRTIRVLLEGGDLLQRRHHAHRVERDPAQEGKVFRRLQQREVIPFEFRPAGAFANPGGKHRHFLGRQGVAFGRHHFIAVLGGHTSQNCAVIGLAGLHGRAVGFAALDRIGQRVQVQTALGLHAAMALHALGFQQWLHVLEEVHRAFLRRRILLRHGRDLLLDEVVNGTLRRGLDGRCFGQPGLCRFTALRPVRGALLTLLGACLGVHGLQPHPALGHVSSPSRIGVRHLPASRGKQRPRFGALFRPGHHRLAQLRPALGLA